jgi:hypothetical protein
VRSISDRVRSRIARDFPADEDAEHAAQLVAKAATEERVQAAIVLAADGSLEELEAQAVLVRVDWRDVLMNGGLAGADWAAELDRRLGPMR